VQLRSKLSGDISLDIENLSGFMVNKIGVAVSGGGDSLALLYLVNKWAKNHSAVVCVVTVDHGLRVEAKDEALKVKETCSQLGVSHDILNWTAWNRKGNLQSVSRNAR
jgi:tRNA(Ile)-lysidine synthase